MELAPEIYRNQTRVDDLGVSTVHTSTKQAVRHDSSTIHSTALEIQTSARLCCGRVANIGKLKTGRLKEGMWVLPLKIC